MHTIPLVVVKILHVELGKGTATRIVIVSEISYVERSLVNFGPRMELQKSVILQKKTVVIYSSLFTVELGQIYHFIHSSLIMFCYFLSIKDTLSWEWKEVGFAQRVKR